MPIDIAGFSEADIDKALANIAVLPKNEQVQLLAELEELEKSQTVEKRQNTFLEFVKHVYPGYKVGAHHRKLAQIFEDIANGKKKRVIVNIGEQLRTGAIATGQGIQNQLQQRQDQIYQQQMARYNADQAIAGNVLGTAATAAIMLAKGGNKQGGFLGADQSLDKRKGLI